MPVKRSRAASSSALVSATASLTQVKYMKTEAAAEPPLPKLTVASPVNVDGSDQMKIGGFLERCHYCKNRIAQNSEVFMYSTLCAFCSVECRDIQINLDECAERNRENSKGKSVEGQK